MSLVDAPTIDAAKTRAMETIKHQSLRAIRFWDGRHVIEVKPPSPAQPAKMLNIANGRGERMIAMKEKGKTLRDIADEFGIGVERVRQIMARVHYRARMDATQPNRATLSVRAYNVLQYLIVEPETDPSERDRRLPERVAALTRNQILKTGNAGKVTVAEVEAWLWERGLCFNAGV